MLEDHNSYDYSILDPTAVRDVERWLDEINPPGSYDPRVLTRIVIAARAKDKTLAQLRTTTPQDERYLAVRQLLGELIDSILADRKEISKQAKKFGCPFGFHAAGVLVLFLADRGFLAEGIPGSYPDVGDN